MPRPSLAAASIVATWLVAIAACNRGPSAIKSPAIDASRAGKVAMDQYDSDGDGKVAGAELENAPSLKAALARLDTDGDKAVSADEVAARVEVWKRMGTGLMTFPITVTLDGTPLADATVTFIPDPCLGDEVKQASCTTNAMGRASGTIAQQDMPDPTYPGGMQLGIYTVKISKQVGGKEIVPARYNEKTILGQDVANDVPEIANHRVVYALTSK
jgi:hypothetical protein